MDVAADADVDVDDSGKVVATESAGACVVSLELVDDPHDASTATNESAAIERENDDFVLVMGVP